MSEPLEISVRRVDDLGLAPAQAYARLRSYTPKRASFLFEALAPEGRYSIAGYRVRSSHMLPPGVDAIGVQAAEHEAMASPESFAAALALGSAGYFSSSIANLWQRIRLQDDEGPTGQFTVGATVVVFDHHENSVTVAGPVKGKAVDRCIWEMQNGPDPKPLAAVDASAEPDGLRAEPSDEKLQARAARARGYLSELETLALAQTFTAPMAEADPFDCYRALCALGGGSHGYYIDFGEMPMQPQVVVTGTATESLFVRRHGESGPGMAEALRAQLPHRTTLGAPGPDAARLVRQLEDASRQTWGGAVGYITPGGAAAMMLADEIVVAQQGMFWCTAGATLSEATDPLTASTLARESARRRLAAMAAALRAS